MVAVRYIIFTLLFLFLGFNLSEGQVQPNGGILVTVVSENEPLIGVTISFGETLNGTTTDYDGTASIPQMNRNIVLNFSYTGYKSLEIPYGDLLNKRKYPGFVIKMEEAENLITAVVVTAPTKFQEKEESVITSIQKISAKQIQEKASATSAEVLEDANIFVQRSQAGGGSPIIRGFEANKLLIVLDGIRMNNAIYRNGHLQNVITVDNSMLSHMEVLYGPSAVVYGSDALGGVIYMETKAPLLSYSQRDTANANAYIRYSSANSSVATHFDFGAGNKKFGSISSITFSRFGYVRSGRKAPSWSGDSIPEHWLRNQYVGIINGDDVVFSDKNSNIDPYLQRGTNYGQNSRVGYWQLDFLQKFQYRPTLSQSHTFNFQYSTSNDIQRYDQLTKLKKGKPKFAEWYYGPQKRGMISYHGRFLKETGIFDRSIITAAYQRIGEDRFKRKLNNLQLSRQFETLNIFSFNTDFMKSIGDNENRDQTLYYGIEATYNDVSSVADNFNTNDRTVVRNYPTRYGNNGNNMTTAAAYANYKHSFLNTETGKSYFRILGGLRYTYAATVAKYKPSEYVTEIPFEKAEVKNGNLTGAIGLAFTPENWTFKASYSTGFRVPNVDDLAKLREKNGYVTIPNPDLKPEYAYNYEANIGKRFPFGAVDAFGRSTSSLTLSANYFYTKLTNAIVRKEHHLPDRIEMVNGVPQTIKGDTILVVDGEPARVVINTNAANAVIQGYSVGLKFVADQTWFLNASYSDIQGNYTSGSIDDVVVTDNIPLSHIPPSYGTVSLAYQYRSRNEDKPWSRFKTEVLYRFNARKHIDEYDPSSGSADNDDEAIEGYGTPKWGTWNIYNTWQFSKKFNLSFNIENILDLHYRPFASGISAPGRNFVITINGSF